MASKTPPPYCTGDPFCFIMFFVSDQIVHHQSRFERKPLRKSYHGPTQQTKRSCLIPNKIENCQAKLFSSCPRLFLLEPMVKLVKVETWKVAPLVTWAKISLSQPFHPCSVVLTIKHELMTLLVQKLAWQLPYCNLAWFSPKKHDELSSFEQIKTVLLERGKRKGALRIVGFEKG